MSQDQFPHIQSSRFVVGARSANQFPVGSCPEIAVAGRSNVGKSSLLRLLLDNRGLVRVSRSPGRTREINFFEVLSKDMDPLFLVDLPGYGYATVPRSLKEEWGTFVSSYLETRPPLRMILLLQDARREVTEVEIQFANWMHSRSVLVQLVITKIDKVPKTQWGNVEKQVRSAFGPGFSRGILFSSLNKTGIGDVWKKIHRACTDAPGGT